MEVRRRAGTERVACCHDERHGLIEQWDLQESCRSPRTHLADKAGVPVTCADIPLFSKGEQVHQRCEKAPRWGQRTTLMSVPGGRACIRKGLPPLAGGRNRIP